MVSLPLQGSGLNLARSCLHQGTRAHTRMKFFSRIYTLGGMSTRGAKPAAARGLVSGDLNKKDELEPQTIWLQGKILKQGKSKTSSFKRRMVVVTTEFIAYSCPEGGPYLDRVHFRDIAGVMYGGITPVEETEFMVQGDEYKEEREGARQMALGPLDFAVFCKKSGNHGKRAFVFRLHREDELKVCVYMCMRVCVYAYM